MRRRARVWALAPGSGQALGAVAREDGQRLSAELGARPRETPRGARGAPGRGPAEDKCADNSARRGRVGDKFEDKSVVVEIDKSIMQEINDR